MVFAKGGASVSGKKILSVTALTASYGAKCVLSGIHLSVGPGEWLALLGPNGSGKSTLLRCITGQHAPAGGDIVIDGHDIRQAPKNAKRVLGYAHPPERLPELLSGRECLEVYAAAHELRSIPAEILDLAAQLRLSEALDGWVRTYSLGMRQKLSILLALINSPRLVVLDEAFNGLDPAAGRVVKRHLQQMVQQGASVLLATHSLDIVSQYATRAALLLDQRLVRTWDPPEMQRLHAGGQVALEAALVEAQERALAG